MNNTMDTTIVVAIIGTLTTVASYYFGARQRKADAQSCELENVQKVIGIWRETAESQSREIAELRIQVDELKQEIVNMRVQHAEQIAEIVKKIIN